MRTFRRSLAVLVAGLAFACLPSHALFRAYLSVGGNDANPCTLQAPCRLLPAALAAVDDGGEIWMLDSGNFNTTSVTIAKSVTILAVPGAQGSLVVTTGPALDVNGANVKLALRNIGFRDLGLSGYGGVRFLQGASLVVDGCRFTDIPGGGVGGGPVGSRIVIRNSIFRNLGGRAIELFNSDALVDNVESVQNPGDGIFVGDGARVLVRNSVVAGNSSGIRIEAQGGGTINALVEGSTVSGTFGGAISAFGVNAGSAVNVTVVRSTVMGSGPAGVSSTALNGATANVVIDGNTIAHLQAGALISAPGVIRSRQNNIFSYNSSDVSGGALTPLAGQ